ncbi:hypothetical protein HK098_004490 [Nowakowskiella sp. JEL0407]|nr:hypothetical protein HK098_004490 [Nowakowskiella sp. JEL0407]
MGDPNGCFPNGYRYNAVAYKLNYCRNVLKKPNCDCDPEITREERGYRNSCNGFGSGLVNCPFNFGQQNAFPSMTNSARSNTSNTSYRSVTSMTSERTQQTPFASPIPTFPSSTLSPNVVTVYVTNDVTTVVSTTILPDSNTSKSKDTTIIIIAVVSSVIIAVLMTLLIFRFRFTRKKPKNFERDIEVITNSTAHAFDNDTFNSTTNLNHSASVRSVRSITPTSSGIYSNDFEQGFIDRAGPSIPPFPLHLQQQQHLVQQQEIDIASRVRSLSSPISVYGVLNRPIEKGIPLHQLQLNESATAAQSIQQPPQRQNEVSPPSYHDVVQKEGGENQSNEKI